jgi:hypothetical protein
MAGYYYERGSESAIDDLYAKAAVFDDGGTKAVTEANRELVSVRVPYARQSEDRLSFCRRFWMRDWNIE